MERSILDYGHIHCIGIGGSGMSALAAILKESGITVSGSDQKSSETTKKLSVRGIHIVIGHASDAIPSAAELVVYSPAVPYDNVERAAARGRGLTELSYPEAVGSLTKIKKTIAVCGTHGKTTTTGMITAAFLGAGKDPTVIIGSPTSELEGRNERLGEGEELILEACEYCRSFLSYRPHAIVITNIEIDHLDYYRDEEDYMRAFREFLKNIAPGGIIVGNMDDLKVEQLCNEAEKSDQKPKIIFFGKNREADYRLEKNRLTRHGEVISEFFLQIPGEHNIMNAAAAFAAATECGLDSGRVEAAINNYGGAERRFQIKGTVGKTIIIDDYGHHPTEIKATLAAARTRYGKEAKILCIFQPHQYSRTSKLLPRFSLAFSDADEVIVPNIYQVRDTEEDVHSITPEKLVDAIAKNHPATSYGDGMDKTFTYVRDHLKKFDVVITMGAGDITTLADRLLKE